MITLQGVEYLNANEVARYLGLSWVTAQKYTKNLERLTDIPGMSRSVFYRKTDIDEIKKRMPEKR